MVIIFSVLENIWVDLNKIRFYVINVLIKLYFFFLYYGELCILEMVVVYRNFVFLDFVCFFEY